MQNTRVYVPRDDDYIIIMFSKGLGLLPGLEYSVPIILTGGNTSNNSDEKNHFGRTEHENISALLLLLSSGQSIPACNANALLLYSGENENYPVIS